MSVCLKNANLLVFFLDFRNWKIDSSDEGKQ